MTTTNAEKVLGGILNKKNPRRDLLGVAVLRLSNDHFVQEVHRVIFGLLVRYYDRTGAVMPASLFSEALSNHGVEAAKIIALTKTFEALAANETDEAEFKWSLEELRSEQAKRLTGVAITEAMEILERGYEDRKGNYYKGHEDARSYLSSKITAIDRASDAESAPEGNIFVEYESILKNYEARQKTGSQGILTGIKVIDDRLGGVNPGELALIVAYAGLGKSQVCTQMAWDCAVYQKKNVFFATSETLREQVMRRIIARHSRLPIFDHPINAADIRKGTLSIADRKVFEDVLEDWRYNSDYGTLNVVQIPAGAKLSYMENRLRDYARKEEYHLCVADYLALFKAETKRVSEREELNEIIKGGKGIAQSFNDGIGIPFVSPWQLTRDAYKHGLSSGHYTKASLADTSEAEKSADLILGIIREEYNHSSMNVQYLKVRDDEVPPIAQVAIDFRNSWIGQFAGSPTLTPGSTNQDDLLAMIPDS